jgi:hypothetical protein
VVYISILCSMVFFLISSYCVRPLCDHGIGTYLCSMASVHARSYLCGVGISSDNPCVDDCRPGPTEFYIHVVSEPRRREACFIE